MKEGKPEHKRSVICGRCLKSPKVKEMLRKVQEIKKLKAPKKRKKVSKAIPGALQCAQCLQLIKFDTPHVALTCYWDIGHKRFTNKDVTLCKGCYDSDPKTKAMWQYLAEIGKNPDFTPQINCAQFDNCPTSEKGEGPYQCDHIIAIDTVEGFRLGCNRAHPGLTPIPDGDFHIFGGVAISRPHQDPLKETSEMAVKAATDTLTSPKIELMDKMMGDFEKAFKDAKDASDEIQDPGMKKFVKCMTNFMDMYWEDVKTLRATGI